MTFYSVLATTLPVFLIVWVGYLARRTGLVSDESEHSIMRLILFVLYPCFVLTKVPGNASLAQPSIVVTALLAGALLVIAGFAICYLAGRVCRIRREDGLHTFSVATAIQNYGFLPIPLIEGIFPDRSDKILGVLFVHNLGIEIALWTLGVIVISGTSTGAWRRLISGPTVSIILGLVLNYTGLYQSIPSVVSTAMSELGKCSIPISLILVGATMAGVLERERWSQDWRVITLSSALRFALLPALFFAVVTMVWRIPELQMVLLVQASMPTAIFPIVIAKHFGGHPEVAVQGMLATSLLSLALTPAILTLGLWVFGIVG